MLLDDQDQDLTAIGHWFIDSQGYYRASVKTGKRGGSKVHLHRLVLERMLGRSIDDDKCVDHANRDRLDNRRMNLREVTVSENNQNRKACRVAQSDRSQYWHVYLHVKGKRRRVSSIPTRAEAEEMAAKIDEAIRNGEDLETLVTSLRRSRGSRSDNTAGIRHVSWRAALNCYQARVVVKGVHHWGPRRDTATEAAADAARIRKTLGIT